jgi:proteasome lid subunit RPN8/RPN11
MHADDRRTAATISVGAVVLEAMLAHAGRTLPEECCGLLLGAAGAIDEAVPATNLRRSPTEYEIDPAEHFAAIRRARATGRTVIGAYYSHPNGRPAPSPTDAARALDADLLYFIVTVGSEAAVRAFRWTGGNFEAVPIVPVP